MNNPTSERDPIEILASEFVERQRRGECPSVAEYVDKNPQWADEIRELFPTIAAMERWKARKEQTTGGRASLGASKLERLGDFRIIGEVGRGGMGIVYEAEQESLGRRVAVKVLPRQTLLDKKHLERFRREARMAGQLHHTNIVPVFGVGEQEGFHYYVMQFIRGVGLDEILAHLQPQADATFLGGGGGLSEAKSGSFTGVECLEMAKVAASLLDNRARLNSGASWAETDVGPLVDRPSSTPPDSDHLLEATGRMQGQHETVVEDTAVKMQKGQPAAAASGDELSNIGRYWQDVARIGLQVADALDYAHKQGTLHRDIKPANLLLDAHGVVWVADFGLAKAMEASNVSQTGDVVGTLRYMAPEQFHGKADARSDIYSLGLTLYELATFRPAFDDQQRRSRLGAIQQQQPTRPRKLNPHLPRDLETIILKAISPEPADRYTTAWALAADLQRFLEDRPIRARRASAGERLWRWCRRNRAVASLAGTSLLLLVLVAVVASIGFFQTKAANFSLNQALNREQQQREKAEATRDLALNALDNFYRSFSPNRIVPDSEHVVDEQQDQQIEVPVQPVVSPETAVLLQNMLIFYDKLAEQGTEDERLREESATANRRVGDIQQRLGQFEPAIEAYRRAIEKYVQLADASSQSDRFRIEIARIQNELGTVYGILFQHDLARDAYQQAMQLLQPIASSPGATPEARYELARTYSFLAMSRPGPSPGRRGRGPAPPGSREQAGRTAPPDRNATAARPTPRRGRNMAYEYLQKAIQLLDSLVSDHPSIPDYRRLMADCYRRMAGRIHFQQPEKARQAREEATRILQQLVADYPDAPDYQNDLCECYALLDLRGPMMSFADHPQLQQQIQQALRISGELVEAHPQVPRYAATHASIHYQQGLLFGHEGQMDEAENSYRAAMQLQAALIRQFPNVSYYHLSLSRIEQSLSALLHEQDRLDEAKTVLESSVQRLEELLQKEARMWLLHYGLMYRYRALSAIHREMNDEEAAAQADSMAKKHGGQFRGGPPGWRGREPNRFRPSRSWEKGARSGLPQRPQTQPPNDQR